LAFQLARFHPADVYLILHSQPPFGHVSVLCPDCSTANKRAGGSYKVADHFERDLDRQIEMFSSVLEPLIIVILGFVIAEILIAMHMPMFDLVNVLK